MTVSIIVCATALLSAAVHAGGPTPLTKWKAQCTQTQSGTIPGLKPGTQTFEKYYDYPEHDRYSFQNGNQQVYRFDVVDPRTKFGKAFGWNKNDPSKCCFIWLENLPPGEPPPGQPKPMVPIQVPSTGAKDLGPKGGGEHYHQDQNLIVFDIKQDWVIDPTHNNSMLEWNKTVTLGGKNAAIVSTYSKIEPYGVTIDDFAYPQNCTRQCSQEEKGTRFTINSITHE